MLEPLKEPCFLFTKKKQAFKHFWPSFLFDLRSSHARGRYENHFEDLSDVLLQIPASSCRFPYLPVNSPPVVGHPWGAAVTPRDNNPPHPAEGVHGVSDLRAWIQSGFLGEVFSSPPPLRRPARRSEKPGKSARWRPSFSRGALLVLPKAPKTAGSI